MSDKIPISIDQGIEFLNQFRREAKRAGISGETFQKAIEDKVIREEIAVSTIEILSGTKVNKAREKQLKKSEGRHRIENFKEFLEQWGKVKTTQEAIGLLHALGDYCPSDSAGTIPIKDDTAKSYEEYQEKVGKEILKRFQFLKKVAETDQNYDVRCAAKDILWEKFILSMGTPNLGHLYKVLPYNSEKAFEEILDFVEKETLGHSNTFKVEYPWLERISAFCLLMAEACHHNTMDWCRYWHKLANQNLERLIKLATYCGVDSVPEDWNLGSIRLLFNWEYLQEEDFKEYNTISGFKNDLAHPISFKDRNILSRVLINWFKDHLPGSSIFNC